MLSCVSVEFLYLRYDREYKLLHIHVLSGGSSKKGKLILSGDNLGAELNLDCK